MVNTSIRLDTVNMQDTYYKNILYEVFGENGIVST